MKEKISAWWVSHWKLAKAAAWRWSHTENLSVLSIIIMLFYNKDKTSWTLLPAPTAQSGCLMLVKQDLPPASSSSIPVQGLCEASILQSFHLDIFEKDKKPRTLKNDWSCQGYGWSRGIFSPKDPHTSVPAFLLRSFFITFRKRTSKQASNYCRPPKTERWVILTFQSDNAGAISLPFLS